MDNDAIEIIRNQFGGLGFLQYITDQASARRDSGYTEEEIRYILRAHMDDVLKMWDEHAGDCEDTINAIPVWEDTNG